MHICVPSSVQMVSCGSSVVSHLIIAVQKMVETSRRKTANRLAIHQGTTPKEISDHLWRACRHSGSLATLYRRVFWNVLGSIELQQNTATVRIHCMILYVHSGEFMNKLPQVASQFEA